MTNLRVDSVEELLEWLDDQPDPSPAFVSEVVFRAEEVIQSSIPEILEKDVQNYLKHLEQTFSLALITMGGSLILGIFTVLDLTSFKDQGSSILPPALDIFLAIAASCLLLVALISAFTAKRYLKKVVLDLCANS